MQPRLLVDRLHTDVRGGLLDVIRARACSITVSSPLPGSHHPMFLRRELIKKEERKKKSHKARFFFLSLN